MSLFAPIGRPRVMGIVNVTPDSFSDGGRYLAAEDAIAHGRALLAHGADILDIGGESTRPGATRPLLTDELARVTPVIEELAAGGAILSVDTMRSQVAEAALNAGARIVNDVSGGLADPDILRVAAEHDAVYVAMHWRAHGHSMQGEEHLSYPGGVLHDVRDELTERVLACDQAGIAQERIVLDPGLGFSKTARQNWEIVAGLDTFTRMGFPVLVGASRKTFLGRLLGDLDAELAAGGDAAHGEAGAPLRPAGDRERAHTVVNAVLAQQGAWCTRVHDVRATREALAAVEMLTEVSR